MLMLLLNWVVSLYFIFLVGFLGEDGKITYFGSGGATEERMTGMCAGDTGAFIDQMVSLLRLESVGGAQELNRFASRFKTLYPITSRCGVFAKTDVQSLLNDV
jgi:activator of 2-hydroxyglutaryl-CoA dehydratase